MKHEAMLHAIPAAAARSAGHRFWQSARLCWQRILQMGRRPPRRLRLCESLPLGERRFVAVVEFEQSRFLVGGTSASLALLARLENTAPAIPAHPAAHPTEERPEAAGEERG